MQGVRMSADALVIAEDDPKLIFSEGTDQFYRVGENLWLFLYEFVEAPGNEEMVFTWFGERVPKLESSSGAVLAPLAERQEIRNQLFDGDLFELSLDELLSATPEMFESVRRGNLFSSPGR